MEGPPTAPRRCRLFVLLQHGSHGDPSQFDCMKSAFSRVASDPRTAGKLELTLWDTPVNSRFRSDDGVVKCGERLLRELLPAVENWAAAAPVAGAGGATADELDLVFSCVGHSFGGVLLREVCSTLAEHPLFLARRIRFGSYVSIATPHCGVTEITPVLRWGGRFIGMVYSQTYQDLFLDTDVLSERLLSPRHLKALAAFNVRVLYGNLHGDPQVPFSTATLLCDPPEQFHAIGGEFPGVGTPVQLRPDDVRGSANIGAPQRIAETLRREMPFVVHPISAPTLLPVAHDAVLGLPRLRVAMKEVPHHAATALLNAVAKSPPIAS